MISPRLFEALPSSERQNWHSHVYEVKSGMLVMPAPSGKKAEEIIFVNNFSSSEQLVGSLVHS